MNVEGRFADQSLQQSTLCNRQSESVVAILLSHDCRSGYFIDIPPRAAGRSDAVAAGWGVSVFLRIETFDEVIYLAGPRELD